MAGATTKVFTFSPDAQGFPTPVLLDSGDWKLLVAPLVLRYNAYHMTDSYASISMGSVSGREKEQALHVNRYKKPVSQVYELKLTYEKDGESFIPNTYRQPVTLTVNYSGVPFGKSPNLYYYEGMTRSWQKVSGYVDPVAVSANVSRPGFYAVFPD